MRNILLFICHAILLASFAPTLSAQTTAPLAPSADVKVEITLAKHDFALGEPVRVRVVLINRGDSAVYVAKSWGWAGGGIAGFSVDVKQLSGPRPQKACSSIGDRGIYDESRTPEQILREDFVLLSPGRLVGYEATLLGCKDGSDSTPGVFQISAVYSPSDWNLEKVASMGSDDKKVLMQLIRSEPTTFRVLAAKKPNASTKQ